MAKPSPRVQNHNEKRNRIYSDHKDWTFDPGSMSHSEYKKHWDKVKSLPSKRAANVKVGKVK